MAARTNAPVALAAMTLASSMILIDQTAVPLSTPDAVADLGASLDVGQWILTANVLALAALMVLGGRLGDLLGLRRVFLAGAAVFAVATVGAGFAQDMTMMIVARAIQGAGAAMMMPTSIAIVGTLYPAERRGAALGIMAGASAFFAALGPVLGGLLTSIDWRLVFLINVPLAMIAVALTLASVPQLARGEQRSIDYAGAITFGLGIAGIVFGLGQGQIAGWSDATTVGPIAAGLLSLVAFVVIELRAESPLLELRLFRHANFLASNVSQMIAGAIELGLGFLMPFYLLLVVGVSPAVAGIALIPATIPIIIAGPLAGRMFDRVGGRVPLVVGFLVLALSGLALAVGVAGESAWAVMPGLILQGFGLGIVLTVNDPTGLNAVPAEARGVAAGSINTAEQLGGAIGIAALTAIEVSHARSGTLDRLLDAGITPTGTQSSQFELKIQEAFQHGLDNTDIPGAVMRKGFDASVAAHVDSFRLTFIVAAVLSLLGAAACAALVRRGDPMIGAEPVRSRRWRWQFMGEPAAERSAGAD